MQIAIAHHQSPADASCTWSEVPAALHFRFGYISAWSWRFRALTPDAPAISPLRPDCTLAIGRLNGNLRAVIAPWPLGPGEPDLPRISRSPRGLVYVPATRVNYYLSLEGTFDRYLASLPAKARHEMIRKVRKFAALAGAPDITVREYSRPSEVEDFQRAAHAVSKKTYQLRLLKLGVPDTGAFRSELMHLAAAGRLRAYVLFLRDRPVAFGYCRINGSVLEYVQTGYDPDLSELSPGVVLLYGLLKSVFGEGTFSALDFGYGEARWKQAYGSGSVRYATVYHFRPSRAHAFLVRAHLYATDFSDFTGSILSKLGIKERFKALLRNGIGRRRQSPAPARKA